MGCLSLEFIEGSGAGEPEGKEFGEAAECLLEVSEREGFADEGEVEVSEVVTFG